VSAQDAEPIKLTLHPAPPTLSVLKYRLLPELRDMQSGNAAVHYLRAGSRDLTMAWFNKEPQERVDKILQTPLEKLRGRYADLLVNSVGLALINDGTRCTQCDWELISRAKQDGIATVLPELSGLQLHGRLLAARARVEIATGDFDDAHRDLRTCLAMARHVADGMFLVHSLLGISMSEKSMDQIEAWIGQSGAPNMYWPLTDLPTPFIDLRRGMESERLIFESAMPEYREGQPGRFRLDREKFGRFLKVVVRKPDGDTLMELFQNPDKYRRSATEHLQKRGWTDQQLNSLPAFDAVVLHQITEYDRVIEELMRIQYLPSATALVLNNRIMKELAPGPNRQVGLTFAGLMLPGIEKAYLLRLRLDRRIAALRTIEAIRMHLSESGKFPENLNEITCAPLPSDPQTNKHFEYRREDGKVRLIGAPSPSISGVTEHRIDYILTVP